MKSKKTAILPTPVSQRDDGVTEIEIDLVTGETINKIPRRPKPALNEFIDLRNTMQKLRMAFDSRVRAIGQGADSEYASNAKLFQLYADRFRGMELECDGDIRAQLELLDLPIVRVMCGVKGVKEILAARIIAPIDIVRADTISSLWKYAGFGTTNGRRDKPTRGVKLCYNAELKKSMWVAVSSMMKVGADRSPYAAFYYPRKEARLAQGKTKGHAHAIAIGDVAKLFLSHLWVTWRTLNGLPVRAPYSIEVLGHTHYLPPADFGWDLSLA